MKHAETKAPFRLRQKLAEAAQEIRQKEGVDLLTWCMSQGYIKKTCKWHTPLNLVSKYENRQQ